MKLLILSFFALLPTLFSQVVIKRVSETHTWVPIGRPHPSETVTMDIHVRQNNLELLEKLLHEVSNPKSENYAKYLSYNEVSSFTSNAEATKRVTSYLAKSGVRSIDVSQNGEMVTVKMPVSTAERVLHADFRRYYCSEHNVTIIRTLGYAIPAEISPHVTHVSNLNYFPPPPRGPLISQTSIRTLSSQDEYVTPELLNTFYGVSDNVCTHPNSTQSLFESLGQSYATQDLLAFEKAFGIPAQDCFKVIGPNNPDSCEGPDGEEECGEANLDVQYMIAMAQQARTYFWSIADQQDPFTEWVRELSSNPDPPLVHSISYGGYEEDLDSMDLFNTQIMKLGLMGVTVVVSRYCGYNPSFPATSPYVTAVGATQGPEKGQSEIACSADTDGVITTGGGFSKTFHYPDYQASSVTGYLNGLRQQPVSGFNAEGRGIPDVSAMGRNYVINVGGQFDMVSGTSASAPVFAGMITLINDARMNAGKPPLGFLNPALYSLDASVWNDVTQGNNKCSAIMRNGPICCSQGFEAASGWDPVVGLGSPKFAQLKEALMAL